MRQGQTVLCLGQAWHEGAYYFKDAARAAVSLAEAPRDAIQMVNYVINGVRPTPSAEELAQAVRAMIPDALITFEPDRELQAVLDKALLPINDTCAQAEWDWHAEYGLDDMVKDFVRELATHPERYDSGPIPRALISAAA